MRPLTPIILIVFSHFLSRHLSLSSVSAVQILSKSKLEKCEKVSDSGSLNCSTKIVINMAVPGESSGEEASIVAEIVEVEEDNSTTTNMRTPRIPPVITVNKSAAYALYQLTYIRDVAYKPEELYVQTRKCEPDAGADVVKNCERQNPFSLLFCFFFHSYEMKKVTLSSTLRFHVFGIGQRSVGFSIRIGVKTESKISDVIVGPANRTVTSNDNFLRANLIGDYVGYTNIPSFEDYYLVIPREADMNRISRNQTPLYVVQERFARINQHPNSGSHSFSIGITEVLNTNLLIELSADDIEYVYQRSPGKILSITVPTFEALTQFGTATVTTKNIGEVEASYSLTEQFYIMKPKEVATRAFKLYPTTDQAAKYVCAAILKDSGFSEVDRAECQFTTTATIIDNGSQIPFQPPKTSMNGFFESIESLWNNFWDGLVDFITGKNCRYLFGEDMYNIYI
ncbi:hapless 2 [Actinidia rufa]|uniref:Hapless 2 n=1 Tax=Actinidia rufa TaxID=165716 RepID=A0A7J0FTY7_9ERIC|nr:hapless 2 [Actinidia rufa]